MSPISRLHAILKQGVQLGASDVHLHATTPVKMRINGRMTDMGRIPLSREDTEAMLIAPLAPDQRRMLGEQGQVDFAYTVANTGRFRANIFLQQRGTDGVFRVVPPRPPTLAELRLPSQLAKLTEFHQGIVLLTGPAGCGKTATLAALIDLINAERTEHILTIEDPIEVLHPSKKSIVNQRQVAKHTSSFARALRAALREDPDIVAIGELRELETIQLALTAAETGHLVLATLHTGSAIRTIDRIVGSFPAAQQSQIRTMLSESLRGIVSQRLVPTADGRGRVPAIELLFSTRAIGNLIRESKTFQIRDHLQTGQAQGMCSLDASLAELLKAGMITREVALANADDPRKFGGVAQAPPPPPEAPQ
jgi:twitching motility protein PilT